MNAMVCFVNVSKRYNLGLTRTSLPSVFTNWHKTFIKRKSNQYSNNVLWALKDVSFELERGQSLGLVGPNGAGKTTILKLLANITKPTSGHLSINGKLSALIELGAGFHPDLTGRENIYLNGTILGVSRNEIKRRFDEIVDFSELASFIDTPVKRYSSGMIVRLGFAVASCIEPEILLVDEVLAVGDASFQQKCLKRIRYLISNGTSIIFVSHNLYLIKAACNCALYLHKGRVKYQGEIKDVFDRYEFDLNQERASSFDLTQTAENVDNNDKVSITKVEVLSVEEASTPIIKSDQPAKILIHYDAYQSLGKIQVSAFIFRSDGVTCCMMRTKLDEFDLFIERGQGVITILLTPIQLIGGAYYAEAWLLHENNSMSITSKPGRSDWFNVKGAALSYNEKSVFEPNTHWEHHRNGKFAESDSAIQAIRQSVQLDHQD